MHVDSTLYERFAEESDALDAGLRERVLGVLLAGMNYPDRMLERDRALYAASLHLDSGMTQKERARELRKHLLAQKGSQRPGRPDLTTFIGCLTHALWIRDNVPTVRQVCRILCDMEKGRKANPRV